VRHAQHDPEQRADHAAFLVRMDRVVAAGERAADHRQREERVEWNLRERRSDLHATDKRRPQAAEHTQPRHRHALAEWVRDEIDAMSEGRERANAMKLAERRAARLE